MYTTAIKVNFENGFDPHLLRICQNKTNSFKIMFQSEDMTDIFKHMDDV